MSFGAIAGALIGAAADSANNSNWMSYSASKSLNKKTAKQNAAIALSTARQLATQQPSWQVQGLRDAGLNPILAANDFGNASLPSVSGSAGSGGSGGIDNPVSTALQIENAQKQNSNLDAQNELLSVEKKQVEANILKTLSESELNSAKTRATHQDTLNKANTRGLTGPFGAANQIGQDLGKLFNSAKDGSVSAGKKVVDFIKRSASPSSNSAKDYSDGVKKVKKQFGGAFYDSRH